MLFIFNWTATGTTFGPICECDNFIVGKTALIWKCSAYLNIFLMVGGNKLVSPCSCVVQWLSD